MSSTLITATGVSATVSAVAVIAITILLIARELSEASGRPTLKVFSRRLVVFIVPLLLVIVYVMIIQALRVAY